MACGHALHILRTVTGRSDFVDGEGKVGQHGKIGPVNSRHNGLLRTLNRVGCIIFAWLLKRFSIVPYGSLTPTLYNYKCSGDSNPTYHNWRTQGWNIFLKPLVGVRAPTLQQLPAAAFFMVPYGLGFLSCKCFQVTFFRRLNLPPNGVRFFIVPCGVALYPADSFK